MTENSSPAASACRSPYSVTAGPSDRKATSGPIGAVPSAFATSGASSEIGAVEGTQRGSLPERPQNRASLPRPVRSTTTRPEPVSKVQYPARPGSSPGR